MTTPYVCIEDKHGATASIFIQPDNNHQVRYVDNNGHPFFSEEYDRVEIEKIEQSVMDWASGKRILA